MRERERVDHQLREGLVCRRVGFVIEEVVGAVNLLLPTAGMMSAAASVAAFSLMLTMA